MKFLSILPVLKDKLKFLFFALNPIVVFFAFYFEFFGLKTEGLASDIFLFVHQLIMLILLVIAYGFYKKENYEKLNTQKINVKNSLLTLLLFLILNFAYLIFYINTPIHLKSAFEVTNILRFLPMIFLAPIYEELLVRGIFYNLLRRKYSVFLSVLFCTFYFAACHGNIPYYFIPGLILTMIYVKSRNIIYPIVFHSLSNLVSFVLKLT